MVRSAPGKSQPERPSPDPSRLKQRNCVRGGTGEGVGGPHLRRLQRFQRTLDHGTIRPPGQRFMECGSRGLGSVVGEVLRSTDRDVSEPWRVTWSGLATCNQWECSYCSRPIGLRTGTNLHALNTWMSGEADGPLAAFIGWLSRAQALRPLFWTATLPGIEGRTVGEAIDVHLRVMRVLSTGRARRRLSGDGLIAAFRKFDDTLSTGSGFWNRHVHQHGIMWVRGLGADEVNKLVRPYVVRAIERVTGQEARPDIAFRAEEVRSSAVYGYAMSGLQEVDESLLDPAVMETIGVGKRSAMGSWNLHEALADLEAGNLEAETDQQLRTWYRERWTGYYRRQRVGLISWSPVMRKAWRNIGLALDLPPTLAEASASAVASTLHSQARARRIVEGQRPTGEPVLMEHLSGSRHGLFYRHVIRDGWRVVANTGRLDKGVWSWLVEDSGRLLRAEFLIIEAVAAAFNADSGEVRDIDWSRLEAYLAERRRE